MKMPLELPPGLSGDDTMFAAGGRWADGSNVRFRLGRPETIGGWERLMGESLTGVCRAVFPWTDNKGVLDPEEPQPCAAQTAYYFRLAAAAASAALAAAAARVRAAKEDFAAVRAGHQPVACRHQLAARRGHRPVETAKMANPATGLTRARAAAAPILDYRWASQASRQTAALAPAAA